MSKKKKPMQNTEKSQRVSSESVDVSRRSFLEGAAVSGLTAAGLGLNLANTSPARAHDDDDDRPRSGGSRDRVLLKGGIVLSMDPAVGDFEKADVLIEGKKIIAVRPNIHASGKVIDCRGMIVMPGFISTHCHQSLSLQRALVPDGLIIFAADADQQKTYTATNFYEGYSTVVSFWQSGRIGSAAAPVWDLGRSPYDPEDHYNAELLTSLTQIAQGVTCGDEIAGGGTLEVVDAKIQGIKDSGRRTLYTYNGVEIKSVADKWFTSKDQLITLGYGGGINVVNNLPAPYTGMRGWQLGRLFDAHITNHSIADPQTAINAKAFGLAPFNDVTLVHCVRWQDNNVAQISHSHLGYPNPATSEGMKIWAENGGHVSISPLIEPQMRHGAPPFQMCLNYGILPSLSPDVECNFTTDPFSMMKAAFIVQRGYANDLAYSTKSDPGSLPLPQLITSEQVVQMMTVAGAAGNGLQNKVGTLTPGKEADIVMLEYDNLFTQPMNNVHGAIVTMMDTVAVKHVMIAGKVVLWNRKLVGWDVEKVVRKAVKSRDRIIERINGPATGSDPDIIHRGMNSMGHPYRPAFLKSCCHKGLNEFAPQYVLRP